MFDNGEIEQLSASAMENPAVAAKAFSRWHVADIIEAVNRLTAKVACDLLKHFPDGLAIAVFNSPGLDSPQKLLEHLPSKRAISIINSLHPDRRAEIYRKMPPDAQKRFLEAESGCENVHRAYFAISLR